MSLLIITEDFLDSPDQMGSSPQERYAFWTPETLMQALEEAPVPYIPGLSANGEECLYIVSTQISSCYQRLYCYRIRHILSERMLVHGVSLLEKETEYSIPSLIQKPPPQALDNAYREQFTPEILAAIFKKFNRKTAEKIFFQEKFHNILSAPKTRQYIYSKPHLMRLMSNKKNILEWQKIFSHPTFINIYHILSSHLSGIHDLADLRKMQKIMGHPKLKQLIDIFALLKKSPGGQSFLFDSKSIERLIDMNLAAVEELSQLCLLLSYTDFKEEWFPVWFSEKISTLINHKHLKDFYSACKNAPSIHNASDLNRLLHEIDSRMQPTHNVECDSDCEPPCNRCKPWRGYTKYAP